jgi:hypothetical protein
MKISKIQIRLLKRFAHLEILDLPASSAPVGGGAAPVGGRAAPVGGGAAPVGGGPSGTRSAHRWYPMRTAMQRLNALLVERGKAAVTLEDVKNLQTAQNVIDILLDGDRAAFLRIFTTKVEVKPLWPGNFPMPVEVPMSVEEFERRLPSEVSSYHNLKGVIYSFWLGSGIKAIERELERNGKTFELITGEIPPNERSEAVARFNAFPNEVVLSRPPSTAVEKTVAAVEAEGDDASTEEDDDDGKAEKKKSGKKREPKKVAPADKKRRGGKSGSAAVYEVLSPTEAKRKLREFPGSKILQPIQYILISKAGGQGLDLKGGRFWIGLEPSWNEPTAKQSKARVIRFESHTHLPVHEQRVDAIELFLMKPAGVDIPEDRIPDKPSADGIMLALRQNKKTDAEKFEAQYLLPNSIEQNPLCQS